MVASCGVLCGTKILGIIPFLSSPSHLPNPFSHLSSLTHTSMNRPMEGRALTAREILTKPPAYPPSTKTEYSNYNYIIAGAILEKLTGILFS